MMILGVWLPNERHNYYPEYRKQYRYPNANRILSDEVLFMKTIQQEERTTYFQTMSKDTGLLGLSILHRLHSLYEFDVLKDTVFDVMHLLPLNLVKNHIQHLLSEEKLDMKEFGSKLSKMPWTTGKCMSKCL